MSIFKNLPCFRMGLTLHQHGHSHTGAVDDTSPLLEAHTHNGKSENIIVTAAFIHVLGDLIQSVGVFIASLVLYFLVTKNLYFY